MIFPFESSIILHLKGGFPATLDYWRVTPDFDGEGHFWRCLALTLRVWLDLSSRAGLAEGRFRERLGYVFALSSFLFYQERMLM